MENIYRLELMWNEISPTNKEMAVLSLWFHLSRWDLGRVDIGRKELLKNVTLNLNIAHIGGKVSLFNASKTIVFDPPTGKVIIIKIMWSFHCYISHDLISTTQ